MGLKSSKHKHSLDPFYDILMKLTRIGELSTYNSKACGIPGLVLTIAYRSMDQLLNRKELKTSLLFPARYVDNILNKISNH